MNTQQIKEALRSGKKKEADKIRWKDFVSTGSTVLNLACTGKPDAGFAKGQEEWLPVVGWEGLYEVSNLGRVRSLSRNVVRKDGKRYPVKGRLLKVSIKKGDFYPFVSLCNRGQETRYAVHRLVLETFVGPCPPGMEARHFPDRNPANNRLDNLSWATEKTNQRDRIAHGTDCRGEKSRNAKLNSKQVKQIRRFCKAKILTQEEIGEIYGVTQMTVSAIVNGRNWKHLK